MLGTREVAKVVGRRKSPGKRMFNLKFFALLIEVSGLERGWGKQWYWELSGNLDHRDISFFYKPSIKSVFNVMLYII